MCVRVSPLQGVLLWQIRLRVLSIELARRTSPGPVKAAAVAAAAAGDDAIRAGTRSRTSGHKLNESSRGTTIQRRDALHVLSSKLQSEGQAGDFGDILWGNFFSGI